MGNKFVIADPGVCIGCKTCMAACLSKHDVCDDVAQARLNLVTTLSVSAPIVCHHCADAPCAAACPTGALFLDADHDRVGVRAERCIGCSSCVMACPYGVRTYDESKDKGVIEKCTMCAHLIDKGEKPACVKHCPGQARLFGDLNDPESDVSKRLAEADDAQVLFADMGMNPSVHYLGLDKTMAMERVSAVHKGGNVKTPYEGRL